MTDVLAVTAAAWGLLMALAPVLQIRRMLETRSSADVSLTWLAVLIVGFALWIAYGISLGNFALIVPNSVALAVGLLTVGIAWQFRNGRPAAEVSRR
jgi:MtN3 and saliva related transmembrane protein